MRCLLFSFLGIFLVGGCAVQPNPSSLTPSSRGEKHSHALSDPWAREYWEATSAYVDAESRYLEHGVATFDQDLLNLSENAQIFGNNPRETMTKLAGQFYRIVASSEDESGKPLISGPDEGATKLMVMGFDDDVVFDAAKRGGLEGYSGSANDPRLRPAAAVQDYEASADDLVTFSEKNSPVDGWQEISIEIAQIHQWIASRLHRRKTEIPWEQKQRQQAQRRDSAEDARDASDETPATAVPLAPLATFVEVSVNHEGSRQRVPLGTVACATQLDGPGWRVQRKRLSMAYRRGKSYGLSEGEAFHLEPLETVCFELYDKAWQKSQYGVVSAGHGQKANAATLFSLFVPASGEDSGGTSPCNR